MKSIKITVILLFLTTLATAQIKIGGKLLYGSEIESLGIGAKAIYDLNEKISLSGELNYFFGSSEVDTGLVTLNTDLHYNLNLLNSNELKLYGIGGLNFSFYNTESSSDSNIPGIGSQSSSLDNNETFIGLNLGIGGGYSIADNLDLISELKYIISDLDQIVFSAGIIYSLD